MYTHFATADEPDSPLFGAQRLRFERALVRLLRTAENAEPREALSSSGLGELGGAGPYVHAANSAGLLRDSRVWYDRVRPGLLLYGIVPPPLGSTIPLEAAMALVSRIVAVKGVRPGEGVGYGVRFSADTPRTVATVPAGYADGLDLRLADAAPF